ncbi:hypothetical protein EHR01_06500 [Leptospira mtsangambouensis]|uniref:Uncharacterized protein n=1 Tax=Leptospira mtsangambouensis TaxID=2484912 RepID=A0ABY2P5K3_9LEPT|nr:hypothetical protein [Leptospira mtsangambouensis]TGM82425.1 hypothetical protein EHR01_06500 [Leptospira mtsangambouensis]
MIYNIKLKTYRNFSNLPKYREYLAIYEIGIGLEIQIEDRTRYFIEENCLKEIIKKKFNLPGISKDELKNIVFSNSTNDQSIFIYDLEFDYFEDDFMNFIYIIKIIHFHTNTTAQILTNFQKFLSDNIALFYNNEYKTAIPFSYYLPIEAEKNSLENLHQKSFLNYFSISENETLIFENYYKPFVTPSEKIHLSYSEQNLYYWILQKANKILRKFSK